MSEADLVYSVQEAEVHWIVNLDFLCCTLSRTKSLDGEFSDWRLESWISHVHLVYQIPHLHRAGSDYGLWELWDHSPL